MREHDWLTVLEFGRVDDGQASSRWDGLGDEHGRVGMLHDRDGSVPNAEMIGFRICGVRVRNPQSTGRR